MTRVFTTLAASVLVIACGVVHGFCTDRWQQPVEMAAAAARMEATPLEFGDWTGSAIDVKHPQSGGVAGTIERRYRNRRTGDVVSVYLVCGRAGPVSIHPPEACYAASGFIVETKVKASVRDGADFWSADALKSKATDETHQRIFWAWNDGKGWAAPDDARWTFVACRRSPVLYKLYVVRDLNGPALATKEEPCQTFLQALLPELDRAIIAPGS